MPESFEHILVIDTGGTSARSILKKLRALGVSSVLVSSARIEYLENTKGAIIAGNGIVLKATEGAMEKILSAPVPVLALNVNAEVILTAGGGETGEAVFEKRASHVAFDDNALFSDLTEGDRYFERLPDARLPACAHPIARAEGHVCAYRMKDKPLFGAFFSVESNDPDGLKMLENFAKNVCNCAFSWRMDSYLDRAVIKMREAFPSGRVMVACSGGLLSTVSFLIADKALGDRAECAIVDTGLLPKGEIEYAQRAIFEACGREITVFDAKEEIFLSLKGVSGAREKRDIVYKIIHETIKSAAEHVFFASMTHEYSPVDALFRSEVRTLGKILRLSDEFVSRRPFPGGGLAVRMSGEATKEKIGMLKNADHTFVNEILASNLDKKLWQYYVSLISSDAGAFLILHALLPADHAGGYAYRLPYDVIEKTVMRVMEICPGAEGVLYDVSGRWTPLFSL